MADLRVVAVITAKQGSEQIVREGLSALTLETRKEPGCVDYKLYESGATPGTFITVETWKAQSDLDAHFASPHLAAAMQLAGEHLDPAPAIHPLIPVV